MQNVLATGGATLEIGGTRQRTTNPRVIRDPRRRLVPPLVRAVLRLIGADEFLLLDA